MTPSQIEQYKKDIESSRQWLVKLATGAATVMFKHQDAADLWCARLELLSVCANLPGDMPLRIRCLPDAFKAKA